MTQTIEYQILNTYDGFETRLYAASAMAEAARACAFDDVGETFKPLAHYIKGHNRTQQDIPMTTPVMTVPLDGTPLYTLQFFLPAPWIVDTAPLPKSEQVALKSAPVRKVAALRYSGVWTQERFQRKAEVLQQALAQADITPVGSPILARYDAPYWPLFFMRRNEVWIEIA